jgi:mycofactocin glycosyltransferase
MIPFVYRLREEVRIQEEATSALVVTETPLNVLRVSLRAARILRLCDGRLTLEEITRQLGQIDEHGVYRICDSFNRKGFLEIYPAPSDGNRPTISVIIPTRDRKDVIIECLDSVFDQDYQKDRIEVIVVDDGSVDGTDAVLSGYPCRVITHPESRGQSCCRNAGAAIAQGEILAFLDSDCVASPLWLKELTPSFEWEEVGAVGGFVDGYFEGSTLDRYEKTFSSLNMGKRVLNDGDDSSTLYVPTCNLLVRRSVYEKVGGIAEDMRVGEDVDFCWRMRKEGYRLIYIPYGPVKHKHRNTLTTMLKRRAEYGTSEAVLYGLHDEKKKILPLPPLATIVFLALCTAVLLLSPFPLLAGASVFLFDFFRKRRRMKRVTIPIRSLKILFSLARTYLSLFYFISFHLVRYYAILLLLIGLLFPPCLLLCAGILLLASVVDYSVKGPGLSFPAFLLYYTLEHFAYQIGVFASCVRRRTFGSYRVVFRRRFS